MFEFSRSKHLDLAKLHRRAGKLFRVSWHQRNKRLKKRLTSIFGWSGMAILIFFLILAIYLLAGAVGLKTAYEAAQAGNDHLLAAGKGIKQENYGAARTQALLAAKKFGQARIRIENRQSDKIWRLLPGVGHALGSFYYYFGAVELYSQAVSKLAQIGQEYERALTPVLNALERDREDKQNLLGVIYRHRPELIGAQANLELAQILFEEADKSRLVRLLTDDAEASRGQLARVRELLDAAVPLAELIPEILGYPREASYLVVFQDRSVLWPSGGKITAYGKLAAADGEIVSFRTYSAADLDAMTQNKLSIYAPESLQKLTGAREWLFSESNWTEDWPVAAGQIMDIFRWRNDFLGAAHPGYIGQSDGLAGIITLNQAVLSDWLAYAGPVVVDGTVYHEGNISGLFSSKSAADKAALGPIVESLILKLSSSPKNELKPITRALYSHLLNKNIQLSFSDPEYNAILNKYGLYESIKEAKNDFIMVADANLSENVGNGTIDRSLDYSLRQDMNGLFAEAGLNYSYQGAPDPEKEDYRVFTRLLVPAGSLLIGTDGVRQDDVEVSDELGKRVFMVYHELKPGAISNILFRYKLPESIEDNIDRKVYELYLQKQAGADPMHSRIELEFNSQIVSYWPIGFFVSYDDNKIKWETDFNTDKIFSIKLN